MPVRILQNRLRHFRFTYSFLLCVLKIYQWIEFAKLKESSPGNIALCIVIPGENSHSRVKLSEGNPLGSEEIDQKVLVEDECMSYFTHSPGVGKFQSALPAPTLTRFFSTV